MPFDAERLKGVKAIVDVIDADTGEVILEVGKKLAVRAARQLAEKGVKAIKVPAEEPLRPVPGAGSVRSGDGRNLRRGGRRITIRLCRC